MNTDFNLIKKTLKNIKKETCLTKHNKVIKLGKSIFISRNLAENSENINADVYSGYKNNFNFAIKVIPLEYTGIKYIKNHNSLRALNSDNSWSELYFFRLLSMLNEQKICNFFPSLYKYFICKNCIIKNKEVTHNNTNCLIILTELADTTLSDLIWKKHTNLRYTEIVSIYLQVYIAIYTMRKYFGIWHNDLHNRNILISKIQSGGYWSYKINNKTINVPNFGYKVLLNDFGYSSVPGIIEPVSLSFLLTKKHKKNYYFDYNQTTDDSPNDNVNTLFGDLLGKSVKKILETKGPVNLIFSIADKIKPYITGNKIDVYNTDKKFISKNIKNYYIPSHNL